MRGTDDVVAATAPVQTTTVVTVPNVPRTGTVVAFETVAHKMKTIAFGASFKGVIVDERAVPRPRIHETFYRVFPMAAGRA